MDVGGWIPVEHSLTPFFDQVGLFKARKPIPETAAKWCKSHKRDWNSAFFCDSCASSWLTHLLPGVYSQNIKDVRSYPCRSMENAIKLVERFIVGVTKPRPAVEPATLAAVAAWVRPPWLRLGIHAASSRCRSGEGGSQPTASCAPAFPSSRPFPYFAGSPMFRQWSIDDTRF